MLTERSANDTAADVKVRLFNNTSSSTTESHCEFVVSSDNHFVETLGSTETLDDSLYINTSINTSITTETTTTTDVMTANAHYVYNSSNTDVKTYRYEYFDDKLIVHEYHSDSDDSDYSNKMFYEIYSGLPYVSCCGGSTVDPSYPDWSKDDDADNADNADTHL